MESGGSHDYKIIYTGSEDSRSRSGCQWRHIIGRAVIERLDGQVGSKYGPPEDRSAGYEYRG
jgi:hypothetical protein